MLKKYIAYSKVSFQELSTYKADYLVGIVSNMVFFFIYLTLWRTIYAATGVSDVKNYTLVNTITYYLITSFIFRLDVSEKLFLGQDIWSGYFTNDLIKPWSVKLSQITYSLSSMLYEVLLYIPFWLFLWLTCYQYLSLPTLLNFFLFVVTLLFSLSMSFFFMLIWNSLAFYYGDQEGNINLISYISAFLAGGMFPLVFLPDWAYRIASVLPFRFLFEVPANVFLGKMNYSGIIASWGQMMFWSLVFYVIFYFVYKYGLQRYAGEGR